VIRVVIAEGVHLLRSGLVALLDGETGISVVAAVDRGAELAGAGRRHEPDVALVDAEIQDMDGFTATTVLHEAVPSCAVLIMTGRARPGHLRRALEVNADGYLLKDTSPADLVDAIRRAARGERVIDGDLAIAELCSMDSPLTPRELDVLGVAAEGATIGEIAERLYLSRGTVRNYLSRAVSKIGARTRVDAVTIARRHGWLDTTDGHRTLPDL
jgi:two-component system response regulator DesR